MSPHATTALVALKTTTLLLGALVTYFSYKAHARTGDTALRYLAIGFAVITLGTLVGGAIDQAVRFSVLSEGVVPWTSGSLGPRAVADVALVVESALTTVGFAVIVYSLYSD